MKKSTTPSCSPRTAVAYARYSSAGQRDVSIEQQLADIRAFARRDGFTLVWDDDTVYTFTPVTYDEE